MMKRLFGGCANKELSREESLALWVSVGAAIFAALMTTTA